jgi:hypothetical protein
MGPVKARVSSTVASCSSWSAALAWRDGVGVEMAKFDADASAGGLVAAGTFTWRGRCRHDQIFLGHSKVVLPRR